MNLLGLFILDVNIKYIVFSILYRHINVPMACKEPYPINIHAYMRSSLVPRLPSHVRMGAWGRGYMRRRQIYIKIVYLLDALLIRSNDQAYMLFN